MDFHGMTRRELQALCKKNKIPANQTNVAMADALHALSNVEGIEELSQPEGFLTPAPPRTSQRTARKKKSEVPPDAMVIELEDSAAPVSRATRRGTAARASASRRRVTSAAEEGGTKEVAALEALQSPLPTRTAATRRLNTAGKSTRSRASEAQHDVGEKENIIPAGTESNLKMSARRRSARLKSVDQSVEVLPPSAVTKSRRKKMAVKIGALNEEPEEECTENMAELEVDTVETADFTNVEEGALEIEDKTGLFPASNDLTVEATEEITLSEENKSEVVDEKELNGDVKSEPLLPAEVMSPTKESKLDVVDGTNTALLEKETESVVMSARRSARIKSVNKAVEKCPSVSKSRSKKIAVKIGALTEEQEDFTENMPGKMVVTVDSGADYTNVDKAGPYSGSNDLQNAGGEDESNSAVEAAEGVALSEESKSEVADAEEETGDVKSGPLPQAEVMMPSSEEIKYDVADNTNIALLEEETKTVNQESFLGDMDEEDSHTQLPNTSSNVLEDGGKAVNKDSLGGSIGNFSVDDSAASEQTVSNAEQIEMELNWQEELKSLNPAPTETKIEENEQIAGLAADVSIKDTNLFVGDVPVEAEQTVSNAEQIEMELNWQEELKSLYPTPTETKIEEYEQIAGLAADVSIKDTNLFVGDVPVDAVGEELAVNINNIEWSFFMGGCGDSAILSPDATSSVLTAKEHDILASNRVSESPFLLNILYEEEPSEKDSERILIVDTEKENLNTNSVSKTPILFDTAEPEAMLVVGTEKKTPGKESVKKNLTANSVSTTPNLFNTVTEEMLLVGTEKKTPKKTSATPGKSNGKKKTQEDADKENNGAQSLKRESVKKPLQLVIEKRVKEKSSMYQDLSLRQLKVLYKEKTAGVKTPALQPLNQNCLPGDGNI